MQTAMCARYGTCLLSLLTSSSWKLASDRHTGLQQVQAQPTGRCCRQRGWHASGMMAATSLSW